MSGLKSIVFTTLLAAACGVGVVALVAHTVDPDGPLFMATGSPALPEASVRGAGGAGGTPGPGGVTVPGGASALGGAGAMPGGGMTIGNGCVVKQASLPLEDGVTLEAFIVLGPSSAPAPGSPAQRLLVAAYDFRLHGFSLQSAQLWTTVAADDRGRRGTGTEFDLHLAGRSAAALLGAGADVVTPYAAVRKSPFYGAQLDPRSGLTWGEIASDADLVLTVSQQR